MLSLLLAVPTVFGTVSSLHPTSYLMIFILVSLLFYPGLALTVTRGDPYVVYTRSTRIARVCDMRIMPEVVTCTYNQR